MLKYLSHLLLEARSDYISQQKYICKKICDILYKQDRMGWDKPKTDEEAKEQAKDFLQDIEKYKYISKYLVWVVKQFTEDNWIYPEDCEKLNEELETFSKFSSTLEKSDINKYSYEEFAKLVLDLQNKHTKREEEKITKLKGAEKVYEDEDFTIIHPLTKEAAILYGKGTRWCTAATKGKNYFDHYNNQGPLFILINKSDPTEKYQFHFKSSSFMDKLDKPIDLYEFTGNYPKIKKFFNKKINHYILKKITNIPWLYKNELSEKEKIEIVSMDGYNIKYFDNPSIELQLIAVKNNDNAIHYIKNPSKQVQLVAVKHNGYDIQYIENPTEKVQLEAVKENGFAIKYIKNPSEKLQLLAVKENGYAIQYIENPTEKIQLEAVKYDGETIKYIENPTEKVQLEAVKEYGYAIQYIENPSEQVQLKAIKENRNSFQFIKNPTPKVIALYNSLKESKSNKSFLSTLLESEGSSSFKLPSNANPNNYKITNNMDEANTWKAKILIGNSMEEGKKVGDWDDIGYIMISLKDNTIIPIARGDEHQRGYELLGEIYELYYKDYYALWVYGKNYPYDLEDLHKLETALLKAKSYGLVFEDNNPIINFYYVKWKEEKYKDYPENIPAKYYFTNYYGKEEPEAKITNLGKELVDAFEKLSFAFTIKKLPDIKISINNLYKVGNKIKFNNYPFISVIEKEEMLETLDFEDNFEKLQEIFFGFNGWRNKFHQRLRRNKYNKELNEQLGNVEEVIQLMSSI